MRNVRRLSQLDAAASHVLPESGLSSLPTRGSRVALAHLLICKSILETLFVAALATGFYYSAFNPYFRGTVDAVDARQVLGWAVDEARPQSRVEVQLYVDGHFVASRIANHSRPDVSAAGRAADEWHGFVFDVPTLPNGEYEARVYAAHESDAGARRTLQLIGQPMRFRVEAYEEAGGNESGVAQ